MATRKIKDAKDLSTNELIYFKGHAKATYMSDGRSVEDAINKIPTGGGDIDLSDYATKQEVTDGLAEKQAIITDLDTIRAGAAAGATALQSYTEQYKGTITGIKMNGASKGTSGVVDLGTVITAHQDISGKADKSSLATVATSGNYNDLSNKPSIPSEQVNADWNATSGKAQILNKPTIPAAVTESTISGWGFTKNTGTYSKPSTGIPKTDLASAVQTSLGKADTALQSHQDISGKQDKLVSGTNIKTINGTSILGGGDITISGGGSSSGGGKEYVAAPLMTEPTGTSIFFNISVPLEPNKVYVAKKKVSAINMSIMSIPSDTMGAEYTIMFQTSTSELPISVINTSLLWANGAIPTIEADTYYELSLVLNNINDTKILKAVLIPFKPV